MSVSATKISFKGIVSKNNQQPSYFDMPALASDRWNFVLFERTGAVHFWTMARVMVDGG
ncbi:hypothetical protein PPL_00533 [Heterostelium album PN500]|uniref:Uncharacterized protein n=1 Tax=Heterostelium pallidum (strain ATCC 26659 / Pp 5 / PN500) TaxID=670386 RepID=D3AWQ5_HETP5|nr:hypothetical protein PPL_00533 [Heterostelium album PN500]EFA86728.1 hypothetical protein PPL_00533 [Heterostelium album PN500]|eukprot:XP_020438832.1 hypothetical protein PPL_00533 [Heterostelium album PN500]